MTKQSSTSSFSPLVNGLAVGLALSAILAWLDIVWGPRPFHDLPSLLVLILSASLIWMIPGTGATAPAVPRWFLPLALIAIVPISWVIDIASLHVAFISQGAGALPFLLLMMISLILAPAAVALMLVLRADTETMSHPGSFLLGLTLGLIGWTLLNDAASYSPLVVVAIVLLSAGWTFFMIPDTRTPSFAAPPERKKKTGEKQSAKRWSLRLRASTAEYFIPLAVFAVVFWMGKFYLALRMINPWTPLHDAAVIGSFLSATGLGIFISRRLFDNGKNAIPMLSGLCVIAMSMVGAIIIFDRILYPALFITYFENQSTTFPFLALLLTGFALPALGLGLIVSTGYSSTIRYRDTIALNAGLSAAIALVIVLLIPIIPLATVIFLPLAIVLTCLILGSLQAKRLIVVAASVVIIALTLGALLGTRMHLTHRMLDRKRFRVSKELLVGVDTWYLVQNRNYDDPFFAIQVGASPALTQTSESARKILRKMGLYTLAFSPRKPRILQLGLGSGIPSNAFLRINPRSIDIIEPDEAMIDFGKEIAANFSQSWTALRPSFYLENTLAYLERYSGEPYSLVVSFEPFAEKFFDHRLFTSAFFASIKSNLSEDGVFVQWLPLSLLSPDDLRSVLASFHETFPGITAWLPDVEPNLAALALIGTKSGALPSLHMELFRDSTQVQALKQSSIEGPERILASHVLNAKNVIKVVNGTQARSFWGPQLQGLSNYQDSWSTLNIQNLLAARSSPPTLGVNPKIAGRAAILWERYPVLFRFYRDFRKNPSAPTVAALESIYSIDTTDLVLKNAYAQSLLLVGASFVANKAYTSAKPLLIRANKLGLNSMYINRLLMLVAYNIGDLEAGNRFANRVLGVNMHHAGIFDNAATLFSNDGKIENAITNHQRAIAADTTNINLYCSLAATLYNVGRKWEALRALEDGIIRADDPALAYYYKGLFYQDSRKYRQALRAYKEYLFLAQPNDPLIERAETAVENLRRVLP